MAVELGSTIEEIIKALNIALLDSKNYVTTNTAQDITGTKTFKAPADKAGTEQATVWFETSNGGRIGFGKEAANSGTGIFFDQVKGTRRLMFRASATAGAIVWEQPEQGAQLYIDLGKRNVDYRRISFPSRGGQLALRTDIPAVNNGTLTIQKNGSNVATFSANQSGNATANITVPTKTSELTNDSDYVTSSDIDNLVTTDTQQTITAKKTFDRELKFGSTENFADIYFKRMIGQLSAGTPYASLDASYKDGTWHRMWRLRFPSTSGSNNFWGKIKITLYGGYSSFNASGIMSKMITCNFNGGSIYNNVGCYDGLGVNVEKDFRISEAIWNANANAWEILIWQKNLSGNNSPVIMLECWNNKNTIYMNAFNGITAQPVELTQMTTYTALKASPTGASKTVKWADTPVYENPLGEEIATVSDVNKKYTKPSGGIPETDLSTDVQNSLSKADTALQSFTETDPTVPSWAKAQTKPTYTASEVGADASGSANSALQSAKSYTDQKIADLVGTAPETLDTIGEVATAIQSNAGVIEALNQSIGNKANKSDIPTVNNGTLTIKKNGETVKTFSANQSENVEANITVPTKTSELTNDSGYYTKTTYEFNKELSFGSTGKLLIGRFPCYDTNITVEINATTSVTYHGILIIATQNINTTGGGRINSTVYGDATNTIAPNIYIEYGSGSRDLSVYFSPAAWSKNLIHIQAVNLQGTPTDIVTKIDTIPSTATIKPINGLTETFAELNSPTFTGTPTAPTAKEGTNTDQIATTKFVNNQGFAKSTELTDKVDFTENRGVNVAGATKTTYKYHQTAIFAPTGLIMGGTAAAAGLVTCGVCGVTVPDGNTGACSKENVYVNYDGKNQYLANRQLVMQAGAVGTHYGNNLYQFTAARGDAVKNYCDAHYQPKGNYQPEGDYALKSDIPTNVSELANDAGYTTNKGTVTQININGETKLPDNNGLIDLGTIGGKTQYVHNISVTGQNYSGETYGVGNVYFQLVTNNETPLTADTLGDVLSSSGYTSNASTLACTGVGKAYGMVAQGTILGRELYLNDYSSGKNLVIIGRKSERFGDTTASETALYNMTITGGYSVIKDTVYPLQNIGAKSAETSNSNENVLIEVASIKEEKITLSPEKYQYKINVRLLSGTLQVGDRIQLCKSVNKTRYNRNKTTGAKENERKVRKIVPFLFKEITESDLLKASQNIYSWNDIVSNNPDFFRSYSTPKSYTYSSRTPLTLRVCRPKQISNNEELSYIQISNSVKLGTNCVSLMIKPL